MQNCIIPIYITTIPENYFQLGQNGLADIDAFEGQEYVRHLDISNNVFRNQYL